jgi:hypothetical protein
MTSIGKAIDMVTDGKWFDWALEAWTIRGYSVFAVALVLAIIAAVCGGACAVAWWINPRSLVVVGPAAVLLARRIWREAR